jgi:hypothetical protein
MMQTGWYLGRYEKAATRLPRAAISRISRGFWIDNPCVFLPTDYPFVENSWPRTGLLTLKSDDRQKERLTPILSCRPCVSHHALAK